ncbi:hypothetical protein J2X63_000356 [Agromyces sp. 3263]|uniref:acyl-CoA carboxylase epsilon subunit n=1 Tax=Agromyces sp. 3263 TaxID=2817750 RepID=UPI0028622298|nr:acyl-CoA carboxylase epsilon subunit [Agromyces sp. 3263]MDR6904670.1 hypothetical protein [Agromyces sp. 3263]
MTDDTTTGAPGASGTARPSGEAAGDDRVDAIRFVTRQVSDEETAAVTAVLLAALDEAGGTAAIEDEPRRNPWVRSGNALRAPIEVGRGAWSRSTR